MRISSDYYRLQLLPFATDANDYWVDTGKKKTVKVARKYDQCLEIPITIDVGLFYPLAPSEFSAVGRRPVAREFTYVRGPRFL